MTVAVCLPKYIEDYRRKSSPCQLPSSKYHSKWLQTTCKVINDIPSMQIEHKINYSLVRGMRKLKD